jgi:hypothetical protein
MITRALGTATTGLEGQFRYQFDLQSAGTSGTRNPTVDVVSALNGSYRSLRELVTTWGYTLFLLRGSTTALPTAATVSGEDYAQITVPLATQVVKSVDVQVSGQPWRKLEEVPFGQLRSFGPLRGVADRPRLPLAWCWLTAATVSGATATAGHIAVFPIPSQGNYCLWTLPEWTDITGATDIFLFHSEEWIQYLFAHAALKVCVFRDKDARQRRQALLDQLNPDNEGSPAWNIKNQAPVAAGPRTWRRSPNYRGGGLW